MKAKRLFSMLAFIASASAALFAQYDPSLRPKADGQWDFENETDFTENSIEGSTYNIVSGIAEQDAFTLGANAVCRVENGPSETDKAVTVHAGDIFQLNLGTEETIGNYTLMWNVRINETGFYYALLQTDPNNVNDGAFFINKSNKVGLNIGGFGYGGVVTPNEWHTIALTVKDGVPTSYMDGAILVEGSKELENFKLMGGYCLLFGDDNFEFHDIDVSQVAYWNRALTFDEIFPPIADTGDHNYVNGICKDEGCAKPYEEPEQIDEVYQIDNAGKLFWFAERVNAGFKSISAVLTSDIDLEERPWTPMRACTDVNAYTGTFNGQGHTITNFLCDGPTQGTQEGEGFIAGLGVGGVLENLNIYGKIITNGWRAGVVAYADTDSKIYNVKSYIDMEIRVDGSNECGGVVGSLRTDAWIDHCANYGTITVTSTAGDSYGGVAGYSNNGIISNCANYGTLICQSDWYTCELAGIVGRAKPAFYRLYNCLSVGQITSHASVEPIYMNAIIGKYECSSTSQIVNNYYLAGCTPGCEGSKDDEIATAVDPTQLASGEVAFKLNGSEFSFSPVWYQNAEDDLYPVLDNTHGLPYTVGETSGSISDNESFVTFRDLLSENTRQEMEQNIATQSLIDKLDEVIGQIEKMGTLEEFRTIFDEYTNRKNVYDESVLAYAAYAEKAKEALLFLEEHQDIEGVYRELVEEYLNETVEPGTFPNGSYGYIMEVHTLTTAEILKETEYIDILLNQAVNGGYVAGSDITSLITNANFSNGAEGWNDSNCEFRTELPIVQGWRTTFDLNQALTGLKNGVYELHINALYRANNDDNSRFYTSYVYANGNAIPVMNTQEDPIAMDEAEDGVNCLITEPGTYPYDLVLNEKYYYPNSLEGAAVAFKAGRYLNRIIVNVTDGNLKVGIRGEGTGQDYDWTAFNNVRLYYQGEIAEAEDAIMNTLQQQVERAEILLTAEISSAEDCVRYPNFSAALREELQATIAAAASPESPQAAYDLTVQFSSLFAQILNCQKAYIQLLAECNRNTDTYNDLFTAGVIDETTYNETINYLVSLVEQYENGSIAAEDIASVIENIQPTVGNPQPYAQWTFEDAANLLTNAIANSPISIEPGKAGSNSYAPGENGITSTAGPGFGDEGALTIPAGDILQLNLDTQEEVANYTLMWNIRIPLSGTYYSLLQTYPNNEDDATIFINKSGQLGRAAGGANFYSSACVTPSEWHRILITVNEGIPTSYIDGKYLTTGNACDFFKLHDGHCLLFCDNDGEYHDMEVSEIAYWNRALVGVEIEKYFADYQQNINDNTIYPEPMAQFDFNATDILKNKAGNAYNLQTGTVTDNIYTQEDKNLETIAGLNEEDGAVHIRKGDALQFNLDGTENVNSFTMMWNVRIPDRSTYRSLLQTDNTNTADSQMFIHEDGRIGRGSIFGYGGMVNLNTWHHIMLVVRNNVACAYLDGVRVASGFKANDVYTLREGKCLIFCDNDGEMADIDITQFAYWNRGLTNEEVSMHYANYKEHMTTAIEGIAAEDAQAGNNKQSGIYNIMGQKVKKAVKGLYIIDGKKVVVK